MLVFLKNIVKRILTIILFSIAFIVCKDDKCIKAPDVSSIEISVNIERLDKMLYKIPTKNDLSELLAQNSMFAEEFLNLSQYPRPEILIDRYFNLLNDANIDSLFIEVESTFGDMEDIRLQFEEAFRYVKYYYPESKVPKIKTVVTGITNDLYLSDSLIYFLYQNTTSFSGQLSHKKRKDKLNTLSSQKLSILIFIYYVVEYVLVCCTKFIIV